MGGWPKSISVFRHIRVALENYWLGTDKGRLIEFMALFRHRRVTQQNFKVSLDMGRWLKNIFGCVQTWAGWLNRNKIRRKLMVVFFFCISRYQCMNEPKDPALGNPSESMQGVCTTEYILCFVKYDIMQLNTEGIEYKVLSSSLYYVQSCCTAVTCISLWCPSHLQYISSSSLVRLQLVRLQCISSASAVRLKCVSSASAVRLHCICSAFLVHLQCVSSAPPVSLQCVSSESPVRLQSNSLPTLFGIIPGAASSLRVLVAITGNIESHGNPRKWK